MGWSTVRTLSCDCSNCDASIPVPNRNSTRARTKWATSRGWRIKPGKGWMCPGCVNRPCEHNSDESITITESNFDWMNKQMTAPPRMDLVNHIKQKLKANPEAYANPAKVKCIADKIVKHVNSSAALDHLRALNKRLEQKKCDVCGGPLHSVQRTTCPDCKLKRNTAW